MKKNKNNFQQAGFTLIELLTIIIIIGILSVISITNLNIAKAKARDAKRMENLEQIRLALSLYYEDYGHYPIMTFGDIFLFDYSTDASFLDVLTPKYMQTVPRDPLNSGGTGGPNAWDHDGYFYAYGGTTDGKYYMLITHLENPSSDKKLAETCRGRWTGGWPTSDADLNFGDIPEPSCCAKLGISSNYCTSHTGMDNAYIINGGDPPWH